jgi:hypothetical protein
MFGRDNIQMNSAKGPEMALWKLTPKAGKRSENWSRSSYQGTGDAVIVRAATKDDARLLAACEFHQDIPSQSTLFSPWNTDTDTEIAPYIGDEYSQDGKPEVLHPKSS